MKCQWVLAALTGFSAAAHAEFAGQTRMNGIAYADYEGFEEKWKFITVRYRADSGEQRFVWANPVAVKALEGGTNDFPDGSVFAKIGFATEEDPAFTSSKVPSGAVRYQFMVRDKKRYADTGGWGYALFDGNKTTFEGDPKTQAQACHACHQLVPERGEVFSQALKISPFAAKAPDILPRAPRKSAIRFATIGTATLPDLVRRNLPAGKKVRAVQGSLRENVFRGTIDEIRPSLIEEVKRSKMPAALIATDGQQFSAVYPDGARGNCPGERSMKAVFSTRVPNSVKGAEPYLVVAYQDLCVN